VTLETPAESLYEEQKWQVWWNPGTRATRVWCLATYRSKERADASLARWRAVHPDGELSVVRAMGPRP